MRRTLSISAALAVAVCLLAGASAEAQWGNLKGRFVFDGNAPKPAALSVTKDQEVCGKHDLVDESLVVNPENKGLQNVVIYVRTKKPKVHPDYKADEAATVTLDNKNCRFEPHVLPVLLTQTLEIKNSDPVGHNSNISPLGDAAANPLISANASVTHKFNRAQSVGQPVSCNIHPWMKAWVLPRDNPYVAVSDDNGEFEIKNLPAGTELEFQVWQEKSGYVDTKDWPKGKFKMKVKEGDNDLGDVKLPAKLFAK